MRADALVVLLEVARLAYEAGSRVIQNAQESSEEDAADVVQVSMQKLRERAELVVKTLAM